MSSAVVLGSPKPERGSDAGTSPAHAPNSSPVNTKTIPRPIALTIAGSDCSGGAGIQADLKTFSALGVYGASVITALTAQNTRGVQGVETVRAAFIRDQMRSVFDDLDVRAIKTGMLADAATVMAVTGMLKDAASRVPLVVDPVLVATSGDVLLAPDAIQTVIDELIPLARLVTPNLAEAARLLDRPIADTLDKVEEQALALMEMGPGAVLIKGGHCTGEGLARRSAVDVLVDETGVTRFERPRIDTTNSHGTGCTLSAAIAAFLANGVELPHAVERAKSFVWRALQAGLHLGVGSGRGPVDHLYAIDDASDPG